jgi:hypothetical protein
LVGFTNFGYALPMTLTIELPEFLEQKLRAQAAAQDASPNEYAREVLAYVIELKAAGPQTPASPTSPASPASPISPLPLANHQRDMSPEAVQQRRERTLALLQSWRDEDDEEVIQEQRETLDYLVEALNAGRSEEDKTFPLALRGIAW